MNMTLHVKHATLDERTSSTPAKLPSVPSLTTADYLDLTATNRRHRRQNNRQPPATANFAVTTTRLPPKLQQLIDHEIQRADDPTVNPFLPLNAVLNADTGKLEEYRQLLRHGPALGGKLSNKSSLTYF